ncbi:hypothetical protein HYDPIDRAFT_30409 [Hydnomerulius pinastri MD-312]|uniref:Uncharacterized protein n=1 Tax=Hydnomerulius pinastri MD-312 TaxID=994086 RepID=A0A0C9WCU2_9AGAM|nr:hypothetical protein HYDPIDRAFT_30409 [Hydnomerulius pinastri MD-312]
MAPDGLELGHGSPPLITTPGRFVASTSNPQDHSIQPMAVIIQNTSNASDISKDDSLHTSRDFHLPPFCELLRAVTPRGFSDDQDPPKHGIASNERITGHHQDTCAGDRSVDTTAPLAGQQRPHEYVSVGSPTPVPRRPSVKSVKIVLPEATVVDSPMPLPRASPHSSSKYRSTPGPPTHHVPGTPLPRKLSHRVSSRFVSRLSLAPKYDEGNALKRRRSAIDDADGSPSPKKTKIERKASRDSSGHSYSAKEPASLRRAQSLRSELSFERSSPPSRNTPVFSGLDGHKDSTFPPTAPTTPLPDSVDYARSKAHPLARTIPIHRPSISQRQIPAVPIIAPPPYYCPLTVVRSAEDYAVERLRTLLEREREERASDGMSECGAVRAERLRVQKKEQEQELGTPSTSSSGNSAQWEDESSRSASESLGSQDTPSPRSFSPEEREAMEREVKERQAKEREAKEREAREQRRGNQETWTCALGIEDRFRREVTKWILEEALPDAPLASPFRHETTESNDLFDQLTNSPETRFHAAFIFHRYCLRVFGQGLKRPSNGGERVHVQEIDEFYEDAEDVSKGVCSGGTILPCKEPASNEELVAGVWEVALGCLALSVKLHRDFLPPLNPVYASEFLRIAPIAMTHEDLESSQHLVLGAFSFMLGSCTPQAVLDELWNASPPLRRVVGSVPGGWATIQDEIWEKLFEVILEPDMMQYPITLLTGAALLDSLIVAIARRLKSDKDAAIPHPQGLHHCHPPASESGDKAAPIPWRTYVDQAVVLTTGIGLDVMNVLQLSEAEFKECGEWLSQVGSE